MNILEIMKSWGIKDYPNDARHFEQEVKEYYFKLAIEKIKTLKRFDDCAWEEGGNTTREYDSDGSCLDYDEVINSLK